MPSLSLRINLDPEGRIGPGKIALLEEISSSGSISAAARALDMSYKRAWDLVDDLNRLFGKPLVSARTGGKSGGGAAAARPVCRHALSRYRECRGRRCLAATGGAAGRDRGGVALA